MSSADSHCRVAEIMLARHRQFEFLTKQFKATASIPLPRMENTVAGILGEADLDDRCRARLGHINAVLIISIDEHHPFTGNDIEQAAEA